jgi:hypothetical protein
MFALYMYMVDIYALYINMYKYVYICIYMYMYVHIIYISRAYICKIFAVDSIISCYHLSFYFCVFFFISVELYNCMKQL